MGRSALPVTSFQLAWVSTKGRGQGCSRRARPNIIFSRNRAVGAHETRLSLSVDAWLASVASRFVLKSVTKLTVATAERCVCTLSHSGLAMSGPMVQLRPATPDPHWAVDRARRHDDRLVRRIDARRIVIATSVGTDWRRPVPGPREVPADWAREPSSNSRKCRPQHSRRSLSSAPGAVAGQARREAQLGCADFANRRSTRMRTMHPARAGVPVPATPPHSRRHRVDIVDPHLGLDAVGRSLRGLSVAVGGVEVFKDAPGQVLPQPQGRATPWHARAGPSPPRRGHASTGRRFSCTPAAKTRI